MRRKIDFAPGEYFHLYNRGVDKRKIFQDHRDYERFVRLLYLANGERAFIFRDVAKKPLKGIKRGGTLVAIGAYVLMPNHFHLLVKTAAENGVSKFMKKLLTGYSSYFNKRYERTGTLFQGTYQAHHASNDEYLKYLFAYIHLNPIKIVDSHWKEAGIKDMIETKKFLERYMYSSYPEYTGISREESIIINKQEFPEYFSTSRHFKQFLEDWLNFNTEDYPLY